MSKTRAQFIVVPTSRPAQTRLARADRIRRAMKKIHQLAITRPATFALIDNLLDTWLPTSPGGRP